MSGYGGYGDGGEESIYRLIPPAQPNPQRPPKHYSKHPGQVHPGDFAFGQTSFALPRKKQAHATFGTPNGTNAPSASNFTRAHEKSPILPAPAAPAMAKAKLKASVPNQYERPMMGLSSGKNFITTNALEVILSRPGKTPQQDFQWTTRPGYAQTPVYLRRNKALVAAERQQFETYMRMNQAMSADQTASVLSDGERVQLLRHLKIKWGSLNSTYQRLPLAQDSLPKKARKEEMERQLAEVERDIKSLEAGETVLIVDDR